MLQCTLLLVSLAGDLVQRLPPLVHGRGALLVCIGLIIDQTALKSIPLGVLTAVEVGTRRDPLFGTGETEERKRVCASHAVASLG
jgi:hypothetical protein